MNTAKRILLALAEQDLAGNVTRVCDGAEALEHLARAAGNAGQDTRPAVVLLDIKMPKVGGLEVLRRIRADERLRTVPVVMLTSSREDRDVAESYRLGANAYVVKPLDFDEYLAAVRKVWEFWAEVNEVASPSPR